MRVRYRYCVKNAAGRSRGGPFQAILRLGRAPATEALALGLPWPVVRVAKTWWAGAAIACVSVALAVTARHLLQHLGHFYYLPMVPAVMITALLANRGAAVLAIILSIAMNLLLVQRDSAMDAAINAVVFAIVAGLIAEVCHRLIVAAETARSLSHDLFTRKALLDTILTSMPVMTLDAAGRIVRITPAAADLLGVEGDQALGAPFQTFAPAFDFETLGAAGAGADAKARRLTVQTPGGTAVALAVHVHVLPDDVAPEHVVLSLADQSQFEAVLRREREMIGQLSHVWRLNSMGEMAATLAHELNQPLTAATVYLHAGRKDIARAGPLGDSTARAIDLAKTQLLRAGDIIRRMRELISTGTRTFTDERVSSMMDELAPAFALTKQGLGVTVRIDVQTGDDRVMADRIQVQQAVMNLIRNAAEAVSGQDGAQVRLTGRSMGEQGYEVAVEDNGPGIPDDDVDLVFQPMTTTKVNGMGLGLAVTRSIVESHGGGLSVGRSAMGGARFSFCLPRITELESA